MAYYKTGSPGRSFNMSPLATPTDAEEKAQLSICFQEFKN